jgi:GNAT superfamily N-acetyltransferase
MDVPCHSTAELAVDLFDSWGRLKEDVKEADAEEGFVWGDNLDLGDILIDEIFARRSRRRQGLGLKFFNAVVEKSHYKSHSFVVARPAALTAEIHSFYLDRRGEEENSPRKQQCLVAIEFFRASGFRRIGLTHFFGFEVFSDDAASAQAQLDGIVNPSAIEILRVKYGCTCGQCHHFSECMKNDGDLGMPTKENFMLALGQSSQAPVAEKFWEKGGTVRPVGAVIFYVARDHDNELGDGGFPMLLRRPGAGTPRV